MKRSNIMLICIFFVLISGCTLPTFQKKYSISQSEISTIELVWDVELRARYIESELIVDEKRGCIYLMTDYALLSIDITTGETIWEKKIRNINPLTRQLIYLQKDILIATDRRGHLIQALAVDTGNLLWEQWYNHASVRFIQADLEHVYVASGISRGTEVLALDLYSGAQLWKAPNYHFSMADPTDFFLKDHTVYVGSGGELWSIESASGDIQGTYPNDFRLRSLDETAGTITAYSTHDDEDIVQAYRLTSERKKELWRYAHNCREGLMDLLLDPNIKSDELYISLPCHYLTKLNKQNGSVLWSTKTVGFPKDIVIIENDMFVVTTKAALIQMDSTQGEILGNIQFKPSSQEYSGRQSVVSYKNKWVIVTYGNNQLFGFKKK